MIALLSSIAGPLMPLIVKVILKYLEKKKYDSATKDNFIKFIESMNNHRKSAELSTDYDDLLKQAKEDMDGN